MSEFNQTTIFEMVQQEEKGIVPMTRPEAWIEMLFPVADVSVFSDNEEVKHRCKESAEEFVAPVENVPMLVSSINDYKGILNVNNGVILSVVKKTYKAVSNIAVVEHFENLLREQNVRFEYGFARSVRNGRKTVFELILPDMKIDLGKGDTQELRMYVQNSFDGGNAIKLDMGFFRHKCSNMALMVGKAELQYKTSHIGNADERIQTTFTMYLTEKFNEAKNFVEKLSKYGFNTETELLAFIDNEENVIVADRYREIVKSVWLDTHKPEFGNLYWGIYNAYTYVITHEARGSEIGKMDKLIKLSNVFNDFIEAR
jgi:hypothetical protein